MSKNQEDKTTPILYNKTQNKADDSKHVNVQSEYLQEQFEFIDIDDLQQENNKKTNKQKQNKKDHSVALKEQEEGKAKQLPQQRKLQQPKSIKLSQQKQVQKNKIKIEQEQEQEQEKHVKVINDKQNESGTQKNNQLNNINRSGINVDKQSKVQAQKQTDQIQKRPSQRFQRLKRPQKSQIKVQEPSIQKNNTEQQLRKEQKQKQKVQETKNNTQKLRQTTNNIQQGKVSGQLSQTQTIIKQTQVRQIQEIRQSQAVQLNLQQNSTNSQNLNQKKNLENKNSLKSIQKQNLREVQTVKIKQQEKNTILVKQQYKAIKEEPHIQKEEPHIQKQKPHIQSIEHEPQALKEEEPHKLKEQPYIQKEEPHKLKEKSQTIKQKSQTMKEQLNQRQKQLTQQKEDDETKDIKIPTQSKVTFNLKIEQLPKDDNIQNLSTPSKILQLQVQHKSENTIVSQNLNQQKIPLTKTLPTTSATNNLSINDQKVIPIQISKEQSAILNQPKSQNPGQNQKIKISLASTNKPQIKVHSITQLKKVQTASTDEKLTDNNVNEYDNNINIKPDNNTLNGRDSQVKFKRTDYQQFTPKNDSLVPQKIVNKIVQHKTETHKFQKQKLVQPQHHQQPEQNLTFTRSSMLHASKQKIHEEVENQQILNIQKAFEQTNFMRQSSSTSNMRMSMQKLKSSQSQAALKKQLPDHLNFKAKFTLIDTLSEQQFNNFQTVQRNIRSQLSQNLKHKCFVKYLAHGSQIQAKQKKIVLYAEPDLKQFDLKIVQKFTLIKKLSAMKDLLQCLCICHAAQYITLPKVLNDFLCIKETSLVKDGKQHNKQKAQKSEIQIKFITHLLQPIGDLLSSKRSSDEFLNKYTQKLKDSQLKQLIPQVRYNILKKQRNLKKNGKPQTEAQKVQNTKTNQIYDKICNQARDIIKTDVFSIGIWMIVFLFDNKKALSELIKKNYENLLFKEKKQEKKQNNTNANNNNNTNPIDKKNQLKAKESKDNKDTKTGKQLKSNKKDQKQGKTQLDQNKQKEASTAQQLQKQKQQRKQIIAQQTRQINQIVLVVTAKQLIQSLKLDSIKHKSQISVLNSLVKLLAAFPTQRTDFYQITVKIKETIDQMHGQFSDEVYSKAKIRYFQEMENIEYIDNFSLKFKEETHLLNNDFKKKLTDLFKKNQNRVVKDFKLIYRASHFQFKSKFFHQYCYQKLHLLIVIQPKGDKRLYCYSQQTFDLKKCNGIFGNYLKDPKGLSFIYNGEQCSKIKNKDKSIGVCSTYGPIIGEGDIVIGDGNIQNYSNYPKSYQSNKRKKMFKSDKFELEEYDVYEVQF